MFSIIFNSVFQIKYIKHYMTYLSNIQLLDSVLCYSYHTVLEKKQMSADGLLTQQANISFLQMTDRG